MIEFAMPTASVAYTLSEAFPNPFSNSTSFSLALTKAQEVNLEIYDMLGKRVDRIEAKWMESGSQRIRISAENFPSGNYLLHVRGAHFEAYRKMLVLR